MLRYRLLLGPIMIAAIVALFWLDNQLDRIDISGTPMQTLFLGRTYLPAGLIMSIVLLVLIIPLAARELTRIFHAKGIEAETLVVALAGMIGCMLTYAIPYQLDSQAATALIATLVVGVFVLSLVRYSWRRQRTQGAVAVAAVTMLALIYIGILPGFLIVIRRWHSAWVVLAVILIAKCCDIGAYFTGRWFGRQKLIPWLSPGKTWEGLLGGMALSMLVAVLLVLVGGELGVLGRWANVNGEPTFEPLECPLWFAAVAGGLIGLVGQFGDLIASLFKRDAGIKDSGRSIPGFGGVIDVIDSAIVVAPVAYWLLTVLAMMDEG